VLSIVTALRASGITAPFFVCQTTECRNGTDNSFYNNTPTVKMERWKWQRRVQAEQRALMQRHDLGIHEGMFLDQIRDLEPDKTHFGGTGLQAAGLMTWC
jgi:hypothetical protein